MTSITGCVIARTQGCEENGAELEVVYDVCAPVLKHSCFIGLVPDESEGPRLVGGAPAHSAAALFWLGLFGVRLSGWRDEGPVGQLSTSTVIRSTVPQRRVCVLVLFCSKR